jgi:hypothetical protein
LKNNYTHILKYYSRKFITQLPPVRDYLKQKELYNRFTVEVDLLKGKPITASDKKSVIHFSIDKSATQYVKNVLKIVAQENNLIPVSMHDYAFRSQLPYFHELSKEQMKKYRHVFRDKGFLYSVFGVMMYLEDLEKFNVVLSIRDPRDVLVSYYYSMSYSHTVPPEGSSKRRFFIERREAMKNMSIDEFVLKDSDRFFKIYDQYASDLISTYSNVSIVKYEDMISDYEKWLDDLLRACGMKISDELRQRIIEEFKQSKVKKEDKYKHVRKGTSGDYKAKLSQNTINILNEKFGSLLQFYGYKS